MKIACLGLSTPTGKVKYKDEIFLALEKKEKPRKSSPYFAEFIGEDFSEADVIAVSEEKLLDLIIADLEKCEQRLERTEDPAEKILFENCVKHLEANRPLCDYTCSEEERKKLVPSGFITLRPVVSLPENTPETEVIRLSLQKNHKMFFFTTGPNEVHAWLMDEGADIVACAGKIHTDLAKGFIRGEVVTWTDYLKFHNMNDCRSNGVVKNVDRGHVIVNGDIIEISSGI